MAEICHNTPGTLGKHPVRPLGDISHDAIMLHGFAQGLYELHDQIKCEISPASNSMPPMFESLIERCRRLSDDIEAYEYAQRHGAKGGAA